VPFLLDDLAASDRPCFIILDALRTFQCEAWRSLCRVYGKRETACSSIGFNPKAVMNNDFLRFLNQATREWQDGFWTLKIIIQHTA
jgi:hypothetical protein